MIPQPDVNVVIGELTSRIANLSRENAILKATIEAMKAQKIAEKIGEKAGLQS